MEVVKSGELRVVALDGSDSESWSLFPYAIYRIANFSSQYDSDANTALMVAHLKLSFVHPHGTALIMVVLENGVVVGHLFASMETWFGTPFASIVQYELDKAIPRDVLKSAYEFFEKWAASENPGKQAARFVQCLARNKEVARAFQVFHGFEQNRIIMRKDLGA